ncbi:hypothetical protein Pla22_48000 [Rubripirellula amarantea]|uniref:Isoprenylcysteine carboxyl methyltransferase (ICMT) family protein n=1 Tax=Rubripirellula amarantea TaxID=2527999 RepID=A0A5C5WHX7_9BACT|nr:isoprenylcysteine carboxylmethyltransferase family protein [Rubripirellula amarantea]TWT49603.1 hypothetical protein Pla22_48000 [Rubripirellula amarantea]
MFHSLLIAGQFVCAAVLVLSASWWPIPWLVIVLSLPGILLAVWAWLTMGLLRLRIHPSINDNTRLLVNGPYALVRHPMYTGLLWFGAATLGSGFAWWRLAVWGVLAVILVMKANEEEQSILQRFPQYRDYQEKTGQLVPRLDRV